MCHKRDIDGKDRINQLSDGILISILSRMTMKEAAQTSLISRRWEKLWTFHPRLEFDGSQTLIHSQSGDYDLKTARYVSWVNHIFESCRLSANVIDEFKVHFDLDKSYKGDIDEWVRFAFEKKVKIFELSFYVTTGFRLTYDRLYPLCIQNLCLPSFISLTSLVLKHVNVSDQVIAKFISYSPFLEYLCVGATMSLIHLRVVGPSLRLKYFEIILCMWMKSLEIDAANLLSLKYSGPKIKIRSFNAPNLAELLVGRKGLEYLTHEILWKSKLNSQLQKLSFHMILVEEWSWMKKLEYPMFSQLKELTLRLVASDFESLLFFSSLINACPSLNRFTLELRWFESVVKRTMRRARLRHHHSLKVVEIAGFVGKTIDTEFCMYLIENAIMLEKIIINPRCPELWIPTWPKDIIGVKRVKAARDCAEQLKSKYFLGGKLVFCYSDN